jgi:hypothetical protein
VTAPPDHGRAGVVTRLLAAVADTTAVALAAALLYLGTAGARFAWSPVSFRWPQPTQVVSVVVAGLVATGYLTIAWATTGRTYGAGLLGVRVLSTRYGLLGWARSTLRALACVVFPVGLLWTAVSPTRRSLQDILVGSVVVYDWHRDGGARATAREPGGAAMPGRGP